MKKLGQGFQYTTYDLGNGRVFKKYNSKLTHYIHVFIKDRIWNLTKYYRGCRIKALQSIQIIPKTSLEPWMLGNPKIINELDYEQDKLIPLHTIFASTDEKGGRNIIDSFIDFNILLIKNKVIDKSFNITKNFGLDNKNRIVLMDLGELYTDKEKIQEQIKNRVWEKPYVLNYIPHKLRLYFTHKMNGALL